MIMAPVMGRCFGSCTTPCTVANTVAHAETDGHASTIASRNEQGRRMEFALRAGSGARAIRRNAATSVVREGFPNFFTECQLKKWAGGARLERVRGWGVGGAACAVGGR